MPSQARYDDLAPRYDRAMRPLERWFLSRWRAEVLRALPDNVRVLELSGEMLKIARNKPTPARVHLVQNNAEALPFRDDSFDAAFATLVFCSIASPQKAFSELRRVVRTGGTIVLLDHVRPDGLLGPIFDLLNIFTSRLCDDHFNRRTAAEASRAGLCLERIEKKAQGIFNLIVLRNE